MAVRRESVRLDLIDAGYSSGMAKNAAATALLNRELNNLSGQAVRTPKATREIAGGVDDVGHSANRSGKEIDQFSGRLRLMADAAAILGPSLIPIGAVGIPALTGIASQLGFAAAGVGVAVLAFQGLGDTLKALNKAELEPTAENLLAAQVAMSKLSPEAAGFAQKLVSLKPGFEELRDLAAGGLFPGLSRGLDGLESALPRVQGIVKAISTELGDIGGDAGESLGSARWAPFLAFLEEEGPSALRDFATAAGNTAHAVAGLLMSTDPLNDDFSQWLVNSTADLDNWANKLGETDGFAEFLAYVEKTGPQVAETLGALGNAALQIVEAASPLGGPVLKGIEAVADFVASIADSDLGTPIFIGIGALSLLNRTLALTQSVGKSALGTLIREQREAGRGFDGLRAKAQGLNLTAKGLGKAALGVGGLAIAATGAADDLGLTNTAALALLGSIQGEDGAQLGGLAGAVLDTVDAWQQFNANIASSRTAAAAGDIDGLSEAMFGLESQIKDINSQDGIFDFLEDTRDKAIGGDLKNKLVGIPVAGAYLRQIFGEGVTAEDRLADASKKATDNLERLKATQRDQAAGKLMIEGLQATSAGLDTATKSAKEFTKSLTRAQEVLGGRSAARDYQESLDAFTAGLKDNGRTLDINTEKGRKNQANLDAIASSAFKLAESIQNPVLKTKFLDNARNEYVKAQVAAGKSRAEAKKLADQIDLLNLIKGTPKIDTTNIDFAAVKVDNLVSHINNSKAVLKIGVSGPGVQATPGEQGNPLGSLLLGGLKEPKRKKGNGKATGGPITGPGTKTSDSIPIMASAGEFMQPADSVDYYGLGFMEAIRRKEIPRYATGGAIKRKKPLFTSEGPEFYAAAYRHNRPFAKAGPSHWDWPYQTTLSRKEARAFDKWVRSKDVPFDPSERITDYDMRGYWKRTRGKGWHKGSHFPDTYKTPYDTTFSHESKYATKNNPFYWHGDRLIDQRNGQVVFAADGGFIAGAGGPRDDRIPAWLSNGEFVVNAAATARNRGLLDHINAEKFADGGRVPGVRSPGDRYPTPSSSSSAKPERDQTLHEYLKALDIKFPSTLKQWDAALKSSTKVLDKETDKRQVLLDQANEVREAVRSRYRSDLFGADDSSSVWMSGAARAAAGKGDVFSTLTGDISNLNALGAATKQLQAKGLNGSALQDLLSNAPLQEVQAFASGSKADVARYEALFNQREAKLNATGNAAANAVNGAQLKAQNATTAEVRRMTQALQNVHDLLKKEPEANAKELSKVINRAIAPPKRGR